MSTSQESGCPTFRRATLAIAIRHQLALQGTCALALMAISAPTLAQDFPASIERSELDGSNGFLIEAVQSFDDAGASVSAAGDVNGDGVGDLIIGADSSQRGESYVVFGGGDVGASGRLRLADLDGNNGFVIRGVDAFEFVGVSVAGVGDVNGDGTADLLIGASSFNTNGDEFIEAAYVVFGGSGIGDGGVIELADLNGSNGFVLNGIDERDFAGMSVSGAGDINGDGVDDLIIGADRADPNDLTDAGEAYVVFGGGSVGSTGLVELADLNGRNGFVVNGIDASDRLGSSVSGAGDINADGVDDLIIGARGADSNGAQNTGQSYVVLGGGEIGSSGVLELTGERPSDYFVINGINSGDFSGASVSAAGDVNDDGVADLIISAPRANPNGTASGQIYLVFGGADIAPGGVVQLSSLDGSNGVVLNGSLDNFSSPVEAIFPAHSVSGAGDVNGDGIDDVIIGASRTDYRGNFTGESYVVFGGSELGAGGVVELADLDGTNGFVFFGQEFTADAGGYAVSAAGDINNDGIDDVVIGERAADFGGTSYVVYGRVAEREPALTCNGLAVTVSLSLGQSPTTGDDVILGTEGDDRIVALDGNDTICSLGGNDFVDAGSGDDWVDAGAGSDRVFGRDGADVIRGRSGTDRLFGGRDDDLINGDGGSDFMRGARGDDILFGGGGQDGIFGNTGNDILFGGPGNDSLFGGAGMDRLNGSEGADNVNGGTSPDDCIIDAADIVTACD